MGDGLFLKEPRMTAIKNDGTRAVIYARFSCDNQREESIDGQLRECSAFARSKGLLVVGNYIDRAVSAKTDERPQFQKMISDSKGKTFDFVIVWKVDRFSRSRYDALKYKSVLKKHGVRVLSATEAISDGPEGILLESVLDGLAEYYSADLAEKVKRGMTDNVINGKVNGLVPLGYKNVNGRFAIDEHDAGIVREIFRLYTTTNTTCNQIAKSFADRGIKSSSGRPIGNSKVVRVVQNRKYLGEYEMCGMMNKNAIPAIIDEKTFELAQTRISNNRTKPGRHTARLNYLLSPKVFCGECGKMMVADGVNKPNGMIYRYYKCVNNRRKQACKLKGIGKELLERIVLNAIMDVLHDPSAVREMASKLFESQNRESPYFLMLEERRKETKSKLDNIMKVLEDGGGEFMRFKQRYVELEGELKEIEIKIDKEMLVRPNFSLGHIEETFSFFAGLDLENEEDRQRLVDVFLNSVFVHKNGDIDIVFNYMTAKKTIKIDEFGSAFKLRGSPLRLEMFDTLLLN